MNPLRIYSLLPLIFPLFVSARPPSNGAPISIPNYSSSTSPHKDKDLTILQQTPHAPLTAPWSFYPYTTVVRQLPENERHFFGPLGYHTRGTDQRKDDQTYVWFIPKRTSITTTTTTTTATEKMTVSMWRELTVGTETVTQTVVVTETVLPAGTSMSPTDVEPSTETVVASRTGTGESESPHTATTRGSSAATSAACNAYTSAGDERYPLPTIVFISPHRKRASENLTFSTDDPNPPDAHRLDELLLTIAQMTGFVVVGLLVSACIVVLLVCFSQPLWWPWTQKQAEREPRMPGAWVGGADGPAAGTYILL